MEALFTGRSVAHYPSPNCIRESSHFGIGESAVVNGNGATPLIRDDHSLSAPLTPRKLIYLFVS